MQQVVIYGARTVPVQVCNYIVVRIKYSNCHATFISDEVPTLPDGRDRVATMNNKSFLLGGGTRPEPYHPNAVVWLLRMGRDTQM